MPPIKGLSTLSAQRRETNLQADTLWCVSACACAWQMRNHAHNFSPVSTFATIYYIYTCSYTCANTYTDARKHMDPIYIHSMYRNTCWDTRGQTRMQAHKLWIWIQMSVWMTVAAGCPFRRVITLFPSMTPGDTTVTFHLSQTPEDRERDRQENKWDRERKEK